MSPRERWPASAPAPPAARALDAGGASHEIGLYEEDRSGAREPLRLGEVLGRGGEATVHAVTGRPDVAAKIYHRPDAAPADKLRWMIAHPPHDPSRVHDRSHANERANDRWRAHSRSHAQGEARAGTFDREGHAGAASAATRGATHTSLAWPQRLVLDDQERVRGFLMPRLDLTDRAPLHQLYHPSSRRTRAPGWTWRYLVRTAANLAAVVDALHASGYVVGDLNESNVLVSSRALVTLVDLDSLQVRTGRATFRCPVGKPEYTPPERQGASFRSVTRAAADDRFALGVLIHLLLREGVHPAAGVYHGEGEPPSIGERIRRRHAPGLRRTRDFSPAPAVPGDGALPRRIRRMLRDAVLARPRKRPTAAAWHAALERLEARLRTCQRRPQHVFSDHAATCPWCERADALGIDAFGAAAAGPDPAAGRSAATGTRPLPAHARSRNARRDPFRGSLPGVVRTFPLASAAVAAGGTLLGAKAGSALALARLAPDAPPELSAIAAGAALPASLLAALTWRARRSAMFHRSVQTAETFLRCATAGGVVALAASEGIQAAIGFGSVLRGDLSLFPALWIAAGALASRARWARPAAP